MTKPVITKTRYAVTKAFDYVSADRQYDFEVRSNSKYVDVRRTDGSGIGTILQMWAFKRALNDGSLVQVAS